MDTLKIRLDHETELALIKDAARHLRPADWHAKTILRQALGLPFPYPSEPTGQDVNTSQEHAA
jgi:plasmid stability protein